MSAASTPLWLRIVPRDADGWWLVGAGFGAGVLASLAVSAFGRAWFAAEHARADVKRAMLAVNEHSDEPRTVEVRRAEAKLAEQISSIGAAPRPLVLHGRRLLADRKWLRFVELDYAHGSGAHGCWETVERVGHIDGRPDGIDVVAVVTSAFNPPRLIVIANVRPPAGRPVLEFPAGLVDSGEDWQETSVRELEEETGFHGHVIASSAEIFTGVLCCSHTWVVPFLVVVDSP